MMNKTQKALKRSMEIIPSEDNVPNEYEYVTYGVMTCKVCGSQWLGSSKEEECKQCVTTA